MNSVCFIFVEKMLTTVKHVPPVHVALKIVDPSFQCLLLKVFLSKLLLCVTMSQPL